MSLKNDVSDHAPLKSGVPQGSVLGPTPFIYYINKLPSIVNVLLKVFADDTKSYDKVEIEADQQKITHMHWQFNQVVKRLLVGF